MAAQADSPTTVNQTAADADKVVHGLIFDVAVGAAEKAAEAEFPFLNLPVVNWAFDQIVQFIAQQIYVQLANAVTFTIIDIQTGQEAKEANDAASALKQALQGGDPNAIAQAKQNFQNAFGKLVHFDGSNSA